MQGYLKTEVTGLYYSEIFLRHKIISKSVSTTTSINYSLGTYCTLSSARVIVRQPESVVNECLLEEEMQENNPFVSYRLTYLQS